MTLNAAATLQRVINGRRAGRAIHATATPRGARAATAVDANRTAGPERAPAVAGRAGRSCGRPTLRVDLDEVARGRTVEQRDHLARGDSSSGYVNEERAEGLAALNRIDVPATLVRRRGELSTHATDIAAIGTGVWLCEPTVRGFG